MTEIAKIKEVLRARAVQEKYKISNMTFCNLGDKRGEERHYTFIPLDY